MLLRGAKQLLTLRGPSGVRRGAAALNDVGAIQDGSVLIRDGLIAAVGPTRRIENLKEARTAVELSVAGKVVMPAFVDAGLNLENRQAVYSVAPSASGRRSSKLFQTAGSLLRSCSRHGTLSAELNVTADAFDPHSCLAAFRQLAKIPQSPVRTIRALRLSRMPDNEVAVKSISEVLTVLAHRKLIQHVELAADDESRYPAEELSRVANEAQLGFKLHWRGESAERLRRLLSCANFWTTYCRCSLSSEECSVVSRAPSILVFSPGRELFEMSGGTCVRQAVDTGAAIALSTGYDATSSPGFNMQMAIALAVMRLNLTSEETIVAATINAAYATGCEHLTGSLEVGKDADIIVLDVSDYRELPRQFGINHVDFALRRGETVFDRVPLKLANW